MASRYDLVRTSSFYEIQHTYQPSSRDYFAVRASFSYIPAFPREFLHGSREQSVRAPEASRMRADCTMMVVAREGGILVSAQCELEHSRRHTC